ncbi:hypothetical protein I79_001577 [Cricetulus griseus]|uniref:Uncharacterized protein n=1 Tax=Cricetulus griseus TaxID=10029 RepID=G3GV46_CRIGR|nr:hypothetical protein I79_001577 [Cricetulus griseus]
MLGRDKNNIQGVFQAGTLGWLSFWVLHHIPQRQAEVKHSSSQGHTDTHGLSPSSFLPVPIPDRYSTNSKRHTKSCPVARWPLEVNSGNSRHQVQMNEEYKLGVFLKENISNIFDDHFIPKYRNAAQ